MRNLRTGPRAAHTTATLVGVCLIIAVTVNIVDAKDTSILGREGMMTPFVQQATATQGVPMVLYLPNLCSYSGSDNGPANLEVWEASSAW